jgi:hypothetical protein
MIEDRTTQSISFWLEYLGYQWYNDESDPMLTRVEYWHKTGWYICHYDTVEHMLANSPHETHGPYETEAEGKRVLAETKEREENSTARKKAYDPSHDPRPTDNDEADEADEGV